MLITFPQLCILSNLSPLFSKFDNGEYFSNIEFDYTNIQYADSSGTNYIVAFPFYFTQVSSRVSIKINSNSNIYSWLKYVGVIEILEKQFTVVDTKKPTMVINEFKYQQKYLSPNPLLRTYCSSQLDFTLNLRKISNNIHPLLFKYFSSDNLRTSISGEISQLYSCCILELMANVFDHSKMDLGFISINLIHNPKYQLSISITDLGIGIKASLIQSGHYLENDDQSDGIYIQHAVKKGVTSTKDPNRGLGLYQVSKICDRLSIISGKGAFITNNNLKIAKNRDRTKEIENRVLGTNINCYIDLEKRMQIH